MYRLGKISDKDDVVKLFDEAKARFRELGTYQWDKYPTENEFINDCINNIVYVCTDDETNKVIGTITIMYTEDVNYKVIDGAWLNDHKYASIHRICVDRAYQGRGIGQRLYSLCEERIRKDNLVKDIKVDTYYLNVSMTKLILNNGFIKCGKIYLLRKEVYDRERIAYQKVLE